MDSVIRGENRLCQANSFGFFRGKTELQYRNGWGATAVDALSTAIVMELPEVIDTILDHIPTIDWTKTDSEVSLFETTIRYLGGMISGYDLLKGPYAYLINDTSKVDVLLSQSIKLADTLKFAFNTPSGVPYNGLDVVNQRPVGSDSNGLATVGTLIMEWRRLADLTGNEEYAALAEKGESHLLDPKPEWNEPWPGLVGDNINTTTGLFISANGGWQGGTDSFYEYLIKMYVYDPTKYSFYKDRWVLAADSSIEVLASHPSTRPDLTFLAEYRNKTLVNNSQHLACFDGGNFLLGGAVLGESKYTDFGLALTAACRQTYTATATKIGPEQFSWNESKVPADQADFYATNGFYITDSYYDLRPEVIESYYYAYRMTGDTMYQDWAWEAWQAINATTWTDAGYSAVKNVNAADGGEKDDNQESFLFAEVLKYSYIIHKGVSNFPPSNEGIGD